MFSLTVMCPDLKELANGQVAKSGFTPDSIAIYTCNNSEYQLVGDRLRTCQDNGQWSGTEPTCSLSMLNKSISTVGILTG